MFGENVLAGATHEEAGIAIAFGDTTKPFFGVEVVLFEIMFDFQMQRELLRCGEESNAIKTYVAVVDLSDVQEEVPVFVVGTAG